MRRRTLLRYDPAAPIAEQLAWFYQRNGYVRWCSPKRRRREGLRYKKGDEVRLVAESKRELLDIRRMLRQAGFKPGRPFRKGQQIRQPVYGIAEVQRFLELIGPFKDRPSLAGRRAVMPGRREHFKDSKPHG
jgi:hypothetical protein